MTDEKLDPTFDELLLTWLNGDTNAYRLCQGLLYTAHLWDDLIDKDKVRTDAEINDAFTFSLAYLPLNPFHQAYSEQLAPLIASAAMQYPLANVLEHGNDGEKLTAFAMRNALLHVVAYCIGLTGKDPLEFYRYVSKNMDSLYKEFMEEMNYA